MLKSVASFLLLASDLKKSKEFYQKLGFIISEEKNMVVARQNWFKIQILDKKASSYPQDNEIEPKGAGIYIYLKVDNVDEYYKKLIDEGLKPSSEPKDQPWGNREFVIKDPDGYKYVIH